MKYLKNKIRRTSVGLLVTVGIFLLTFSKANAQPGCNSVDLQTFSIDASIPQIAVGQTAQIITTMRNNGPCIIPTGEAVLQVSISAVYLNLAAPLTATDDCGGLWVFAGSTSNASEHIVSFTNAGGPLPVNSQCNVRFNVGGKVVTPPGGPNAAMSAFSTLSFVATTGDVNGTNQFANSEVIVRATVLPVVLDDIFANANSCNGILNWKTGSEDNVDRFEIEFSKNTTDWAKVGTVVAKNNANGSVYAYSNDQGTGRGYYRLKIIDKDGQFVYSRVVGVDTKCTGKKAVTLYPNPLTAGQTLNVVASGFEGTIKGELISMSGQVIRTYTLSNGTNMLPVDKVAQATYMMRVSDSAGDIQSFRVVIVK